MTSKLIDRITIEPGKCGRKPCIRRLRMRVSDVLSLLSADASNAEILEDYPELEIDDIFACLQYAALQAEHSILFAA
jgi:uncharacterized protein (DUF433 family)